MMISNDNFKQLEAQKIGESGCYLLSICHGIHNYSMNNLLRIVNIDIIRLYELSIQEKWMDEDCYISRPDLIAAYLLGVPLDKLIVATKKQVEIPEVKISKRDIHYEPKENEIEITRYERYVTGATYSHFVETRNNKVVYDPYGKSKTVALGQPVSKRILTIQL